MGSFTDANADLPQLASDALRAPEHVVLGHRLDKRDDLQRESSWLTPRSGLSSPEALEETPMPVQQRLDAHFDTLTIAINCHTPGLSPRSSRSSNIAYTLNEPAWESTEP